MPAITELERKSRARGEYSAEAFFWRLGGPRPVAGVRAGPTFLVEEAGGDGVAAHRELRRRVFVDDQGLFDGSDIDDLDDLDADPRTIVLVARTPGGAVVGGVRLAPVPGVRAELGWWTGSGLVVAPGAPPRTGAALVRAACARAEAEGALRFDVVVQADEQRFFARLGWQARGEVEHRGRPHVRMLWPGGLRTPATPAPSPGRVVGPLPNLPWSGGRIR